MTKDEWIASKNGGDIGTEFVYPLTEDAADALVDMAYRLYQTLMLVFDERRCRLRAHSDLTFDRIMFDRTESKLGRKEPF